MAGESRTELLAWVNDLLQLNLTKVEQCGAGGVYCQIVDSIFGDVPMARVKMGAKQEWEYLDNFKVLQAVFKKHQIDKPILVDRLIRCKMQDNLEFLQWLKRFWEMNFPGGEYDPVGRRGGAAAAARSAPTARAPLGTSRASSASARSSSAAGAHVDAAALEALTAQMNEMKLGVEGLEKERDFYFNKLREIEIIIGARLELADAPAEEGGGTVTEEEKDTLLQMQQILYSTEEGFEVPEEGQEGELVNEEEETF
ncbi:hypothetical protein NBRC10512_002998 [Rhodotorula toruloides]|uniref:Microtubule-associated protein, RP/EB family n=1 Tax=Rhodotorula toruloides (strain NP11) TaxID=1130832 RepID=M7X3E3_RHOT1|nr:microtubule-associated protein, RP/EB family [Rhodotorula toruloides NP11]EMS24836.1 microtubule-associated protein, RP/EB family [Rhodotorula toruloides NP11]